MGKQKLSSLDVAIQLHDEALDEYRQTMQGFVRNIAVAAVAALGLFVIGFFVGNKAVSIPTMLVGLVAAVFMIKANGKASQLKQWDVPSAGAFISYIEQSGKQLDGISFTDVLNSIMEEKQRERVAEYGTYMSGYGERSSKEREHAFHAAQALLDYAYMARRNREFEGIESVRKETLALNADNVNME